MAPHLQPFRFLPQQRIVVCTECRFGYTADGAAAHLESKPHGMAPTQQQAIIEQVRLLPRILQTQSDLAYFRFPPPESAENPFLQPARDGAMACRECRFVCFSEKYMKAHYREEHAWVNPHIRGRVSPKVIRLIEEDLQGRPWRTGVRCQRFFQRREASGFFEVEKSEEPPFQRQEEASHVVSQWGTGLQDIIEQHQAALQAEKDKVQQTIDGRTGIDFESTWIRKIKAAQHLSGKDMTKLWQASAEPMTRAARETLRDEEEIARQECMARLVESIDREVGRCRRRLDLVPDEALAWLASIEEEKQNDHECRASENANTLRKYTSVWKSYVCYCVRACRLGRDEAAEAWGVRFRDDQWAELCTIVELLDGEESRGSAEDDGLEDSGLGSETDGSAEERGGETALDRHVFRFSVASIQQKLGFGIFRSPLVHFMAILAWDGVSRMWYSNVGTVTARYAALLWCARLFTLEHVFGVELGIDQGADPDEELHFGAIEHFRAQVKQWLTRGSFTPVSRMIKWMAYGKGHRRKEGGSPRLMWEADEKVMRYLGQPLRTVDFCRAARESVAEAGRLLDQLLCGSWGALEREIDMSRVKDDLMKGPVGHSFTRDKANEWLQPGPHRVLKLVSDRLWSSGRNRWRTSAVKRWLDTLRAFKLAHMGNVHLWGGQPGRGPEVAAMRHCDGEQLMRNVFVFDGQVLLVTDRDKSKAIRDVGIKVARFLPGHVGRMMIAYVAWLAPVEELLLRQEPLAAAVGRGCSEKSDGAAQRRRTAQLLRDGWLWMDARPGYKGRWETSELSKRLVSVTGRFTGVELGVADYRHVAIEMGRKIKGLVVKQVEAADDGGDDLEDYTGDDEGLTQMNRFDFVFDLQTTHGRRIAARHYAVNIMFPNNLGPDKIASFREVSRLWHCFLEQQAVAGMPAPEHKREVIESSSGSKKRTVRELESVEQLEGTSYKRQKLQDGRYLIEARELECALQHMLGQTACWKTDEQRDGMRRIMAMKDGDVQIIVLPTGGGKSILFMLPSTLQSEEGRVSIVVVPFVALIDDLVTRAREIGIDCLRWQPAARQGREHPQRVPQLLVVSSDVADTTEFKVDTDRLRAQDRLQRIFVDECHTIIMDVGYREKLEQLRGLHRYGCPVILLTATLPVNLEGWFRESMLAEDAAIIRASTVKKNIRYRVCTVTPGKAAVDKAVAELVLQRGRLMAEDQKGVVYCRSKKKSERLAALLGCAHHHSDMSDAARRLVLKEWAEGCAESRWIVATTGLGTGIDIKGITAVIHAEQPYGLVDFVQQTGRGGRRDGETVESVIVIDGRPAQFDKHGSDPSQHNRKAMERFIEAEGCRRLVVGAFMDGRAQSCEEVGGILCDRCDPGLGGSKMGDSKEMRASTGERERTRPANALGRGQQTRQERLALLQQWIRRVEGRCSACYLRWLSEGRDDEHRGEYEHPQKHCRSVREEDFAAWRRLIEFDELVCCWGCSLPQEWCDAAEMGHRCTRDDQVLPMVMSVLSNAQLRDKVESQFRIDTGNEEDYAEWLSRSMRLYGLNMTNALRVWDFLIRSFFDAEERDMVENI